MRILHIIQRYYPARGGAEIHLEKLSSYLAAAGHQVTVATTDALDFELFWNPAKGRVGEPVGEHSGVTIRRFPVRHLPVSPLAYPAIRRLLWLMSRAQIVPAAWLMRLARFTPWVPDLWRWTQEEAGAYDLVGGMTITFEPLLAAGQTLARRQGIPFVSYPLTHLGAGPKPGQDELGRFYTMRHQVKLVVNSDALVAQTPAERDFYLERGMAPGRIVVGGPGVSPDEVLGGDGPAFRARHGIDGPLVLAIGSMSRDKGTSATVEAVRRLWAAGRPVTLVLIGAVLAPFQAYLNGLPPADRERLHVLGPAGDAEKRDALAAADLVSMPSRTDSFGIIYLEAWLYGKPVIGARTWGVMDVLEDSGDGLLVPFGDVPALAEAMSWLLDHPIEAAEMGQRGRQKVYAAHTWDHKSRLVAELYDRLAAGS